MADVFPQAPGGDVPKADEAYPRFPFLFLVDRSSSTSVDRINKTVLGPQADCRRFTEIMQRMLGKLRAPETDALKNVHPGIDVSVMSYSDGYTVDLPWTTAPNLNPAIAPFQPDGFTHTYAALEYAIRYLGSRLRYYGDRGLTYGRPYLFHLTDGEPTDMNINDHKWNDIKQKFGSLTDASNEKIYVDLRHIVTEQACQKEMTRNKRPDGTPITGLEVLAMLSGPKHCLKADDHPDLVNELVDFIVINITQISNLFGAGVDDKSAADEIMDRNLKRAKHLQSAADFLDASLGKP